MMLLVMLILMMSVAIQDTYSSSEHFQYLKDETPEEASFRVLRRTDPRPTAGSPSPKLSMHFSMGADPQRSTWWLSPEKPYTKRRQPVAYYNLNSFGLRYGKREQNMLAGFKQKIHVK
ncbi:metastasis-suppressor KiSS-1 [Pimephales promelas]|uniref:metastasis-suppressor KiSS-1 n=1 Tax=Pimephales promelas TaxID=90988 RepID=UPI001955B4DD|nr:metastasis-suppressor KiSS-1 [Pimephales promelas]